MNDLYSPDTASADAQPVDTAGSIECLTFAVGGERYAIAIHNVREIVEYGGVTAVPMMPAVIRGIINLRGTVVPIIDLAARLGLSSQPVTRRTCIVIFELDDDDRQLVGMVVDSVMAVKPWRASDIEPPPGFGLKVPTGLVVGMSKIDDGFVLLLDTDIVLSSRELGVLIEQHATSVKPEHAPMGASLSA